jgi:hypothetical protein
VQVAHSVLDHMSQIDLDQDIDGETLAGLLDQRDLQLSQHLTPRAIAAEEVLGADLVELVGDVILDGAEDGAGDFVLEREEGGVETRGEAIEARMADEDGFQDGLGDIDMVARAGRIVVALNMLVLVSHDGSSEPHGALRVVAPGIGAGELLADHGATPAGVLHGIALDGDVDALGLEPDVPQTLEGGHVGDVGAGGI